MFKKYGNLAKCGTCNPNYLENKYRRIVVRVQPGKNVSEILSQRTSQVWCNTSVISAMWRLR
jgi:hypothetical protein